MAEQATPITTQAPERENLWIYNAARAVPDGAKKPIEAGRLKGMTDINPMFRVKILTELFGPCGIGWGYKELRREFVVGANNEIIVIVDLELWYADPETGNVGIIPGTGGSKFVANERSGLYTDDEAVKKALTDALSVACKALGVAADVYWAKDTTKYAAHATEGEPATSGSKAPAAVKAPPKPLPGEKFTVDSAAHATPPPAPYKPALVGCPVCSDCKHPIMGYQSMTASQMVDYTLSAYGRELCAGCATKAKNAKAGGVK